VYIKYTQNTQNNNNKTKNYETRSCALLALRQQKPCLFWFCCKV